MGEACMDDVAPGNAEIIERCVGRVREVHGGDPEAFRAELTRQESVPLKLRRACEAAAMHLMRVDRLGIPKESHHAVDLLERSGFLASHLARPLRPWSASATSRSTTTGASTWRWSTRSWRATSTTCWRSRVAHAGHRSNIWR